MPHLPSRLGLKIWSKNDQNIVKRFLKRGQKGHKEKKIIQTGQKMSKNGQKVFSRPKRCLGQKRGLKNLSDTDKRSRVRITGVGYG